MGTEIAMLGVFFILVGLTTAAIQQGRIWYLRRRLGQAHRRLREKEQQMQALAFYAQEKEQQMQALAFYAQVVADVIHQPLPEIPDPDPCDEADGEDPLLHPRRFRLVPGQRTAG